MGFGKRRSALLTVEALTVASCILDECAVTVEQELLELCCRGEGEEHCQIVQLNICGDKADNEFLEALRADFVNEDINESGALAWGLPIKLKESRVVALGEGIPGLKRMRHRLCLLFLCRQRLQHAQSLRLELTKNVVQELVT